MTVSLTLIIAYICVSLLLLSLNFSIYFLQTINMFIRNVTPNMHCNFK